MGFFSLEELDRDVPQKSLKGLSIELLHKKQCAVCPLNGQRDLRNPHMEPTGTKKPTVYILGEAPGADEDRKGKQFVGDSGQVLRLRIPEDWLPELRWNNVVRTRPPKNRDPSPVEIECCRPSIVEDIERTKPVAIFGFGAVPLEWATGETGIMRWSGRRVPVTIGKHTCWFFPIMHPSYVLRSRKFKPRSPDAYGSDTEFAFAMHVRNAFRQVDAGLPDPRVLTKEEALANVDFVTGAGGWKDVDRVIDYLDLCRKEDHVGFDYETNAKRPYIKGAKLLTVGLSRKQDCFAFALRHREAKWNPDQLKSVEKAFEDFLYDAKCRKVQHFPFEMEWSGYFFGRDCVIDGEWEDTSAQAFILDERPWTNSLDFLCMLHFGLRIKEFSAVDRKNLDAEPIATVLKYNAIDSKFHRMLFFAQRARLREEGLSEVYQQQMRRVMTMAMTQMVGVPIDQKVVSRFLKNYEHDLREIEKEIRELPIIKKYAKVFGEEFQPSNTKDFLKCLKSLAGFKDLKSTEAKDLIEIKDKHPLIPLMQEYRSVSKTISTYIKPVMPDSEHLYPDGMIHPVISTTKVRTNRTSSEEPNIQNWTKHKEGAHVRKFVKPGGSRIVVSVDYAGIQARNVAMESKDPRLVKHYWEGYDIHSDWRERIARIARGWITKSELQDKNRMKHFRQEAKNKFVFPAFFGAQAHTLATGLGISENDAEDVRLEFFDEFPDIHRWHEKVKKDYNKLGYVTGLSGFRRRAPIEQNQMINSPIQGDEALIVCNAQERLTRTGDERLQPCLMVHDDLTFIWERSELDKLAEVVVKEMLVKEFDWINVPLGVEISFGEDWFKLEKYGEYESTADGGIREVKK